METVFELSWAVWLWSLAVRNEKGKEEEQEEKKTWKTTEWKKERKTILKTKAFIYFADRIGFVSYLPFVLIKLWLGLQFDWFTVIRWRQRRLLLSNRHTTQTQHTHSVPWVSSIKKLTKSNKMIETTTAVWCKQPKWKRQTQLKCWESEKEWHTR